MILRRALLAARASRLTGPRGQFSDGQRVERSQFVRLAGAWQWAAFDPLGQVLMVVEVPWRSECAATPTGALWVAREIAAGYLTDARCHRGH